LPPKAGRGGGKNFEEGQTVTERIKRKEFLILNALKNSDGPLTSARLAEELSLLGQEMSERSVRLYLQRMEQEGLTASNGKRGHELTGLGLTEIESTKVFEKVGFLSAKIDQMTYRMNFDLNTASGTVVINVTIVSPHHFARHLPQIKKVYADGYAMGTLMTFLEPGEALGHIKVPDDMIGVGTVCSITLNGVLLKHGIPTVSRFGGLLELRDRKPVRFVEIIMYDGTSIDPLEVFIRSGMTNYLGAIETGDGRIGASFREFPGESRDTVEHLAGRLKRIGLGGLMRLGRPGQSLFDVPVNEGRVGAVVIGGLNPVSILEEAGIRAYSRALAGHIDFNRLFPYEEMEQRIKKFL
jgi:HTH-type transcriptional regulator, global nitrogen regulator NrpRI